MKVNGREELVYIVVKHTSTTIDQVEGYYAEKLQIGHIDIYENKNGEAAKSWLLSSSIEPTLRTSLFDAQKILPMLLTRLEQRTRDCFWIFAMSPYAGILLIML
jgi:hypothetical protein